MRPLLQTTVMIISLAAFGACDSGGGECGLDPGTFSTADSGGLCQVNFFGDVDYAVYCSPKTSGGYDCACGAVSESPLEFSSDDFCDLKFEERACAGLAACNFPI